MFSGSSSAFNLARGEWTVEDLAILVVVIGQLGQVGLGSPRCAVAVHQVTSMKHSYP